MAQTIRTIIPVFLLKIHDSHCRLCICSPGQAAVLHDFVSFVVPTQGCPSESGGGLSQRLLRNDLPPPQLTVQLDQVDHDDHFPSTVNRNEIYGAVFLYKIHVWTSLLHFVIPEE